MRPTLPEKRQVLVKVRVVDINKTDLDRLGVNWGQLSIQGTAVSFVTSPWLIQNMGPAGTNGNKLGNVLPIGSQIDLLRQQNVAHVLSEPNLLVDEGDKATINIGGEIRFRWHRPVLTGGGSGTVSIEWKPTV